MNEDVDNDCTFYIVTRTHKRKAINVTSLEKPYEWKIQGLVSEHREWGRCLICLTHGVERRGGCSEVGTAGGRN